MPTYWLLLILLEFIYKQSGTQPLEAPDKENNQPHIVVIEQDDYDQYFLAIEQTLMLKSRDIATALFLLLASHYVFNLSYHSKSADFLIFVQEDCTNSQLYSFISEETYGKISCITVPCEWNRTCL